MNGSVRTPGSRAGPSMRPTQTLESRRSLTISLVFAVCNENWTPGYSAKKAASNRGRTYCAMVVDTPSGRSPETLPSFAAKFLLDLCNKCRNLAGISEQNRTLPGERVPAKRAIEETHTKIVFERLDLKCQRRLSQE